MSVTTQPDKSKLWMSSIATATTDLIRALDVCGDDDAAALRYGHLAAALVTGDYASAEALAPSDDERTLERDAIDRALLAWTDATVAFCEALQPSRIADASAHRRSTVNLP